jgi:hypothetical protein
LEIELILLRRNHYPLKTLPTLIWVEEFEFVSSLGFDKCLARLGSVFRDEAQNQKITVYEISVQGELIYFAARKSFRVGRWGGDADLGGMMKFNKGDNKTHIYCYAGENLIVFAFMLLMFVSLVVGFNILYFRTLLESVGISLILLIPIVITTRISKEMKAALKVDMIQLFEDGLPILKHPLTP